VAASGKRANVVNAVNRPGLAAKEETEAGQEELFKAHDRNFHSDSLSRSVTERVVGVQARIRIRDFQRLTELVSMQLSLSEGFCAGRRLSV